METVIPMRYVNVRGVVYVRAEDVAEYLRELGATEETDVRTRLNEAAYRFLQGDPKENDDGEQR